MAQTATAPAASASINACGTNGNNGALNCMYILGSNHTAVTRVRGWSEPGSYFIGTDVFEQVTYPSGAVFCQSATLTISSSSEIAGCEKAPGGTFSIPAGTYCATLYNQYYTGASWVWIQAARNCGTIS
ncbi:hypothetical protein [Streptomyces sp. NPDC088350]|uniref:hypothetical protein n=1 Tax=Streptomyces sp. NPDC088350 TaxID=3365854 RepID=UPI00381949B1